MHVDPVTLVCLSLATLFVAVLPITVYRRLRKPFRFDWRDTISGVAVFALFATVLERGLNDFVLHQNPATAQLFENPLAFVLYGALAAGVCPTRPSTARASPTASATAARRRGSSACSCSCSGSSSRCSPIAASSIRI